MDQTTRNQEEDMSQILNKIADSKANFQALLKSHIDMLEKTSEDVQGYISVLEASDTSGKEAITLAHFKCLLEVELRTIGFLYGELKAIYGWLGPLIEGNFDDVENWMAVQRAFEELKANMIVTTDAHGKLSMIERDLNTLKRNIRTQTRKYKNVLDFLELAAKKAEEQRRKVEEGLEYIG